jgi:hypothetical protein
MNDQSPRESRRAFGNSSWLFTAVSCCYFLLGGWATYKLFPICAIFFAGFGFSFSSGSLPFHLFPNYMWLIIVGVAILVALALSKQIGIFSARYRRLVNIALLIVAIGFAPILLTVVAITLLGPFDLMGKYSH